MGLAEWMQKLFDEQKWREQQARAMGVPQNDSSRDSNGMMTRNFDSSGIYSDNVPMSFKDHIDMQFPEYAYAARKLDNYGSPADPYKEPRWYKPEVKKNTWY